MIDRENELLRSANQLEHAVLHDHALVRRLDINCVRSWRSGLRELDDRHSRHFAEQIWEAAAVMRIDLAIANPRGAALSLLRLHGRTLTFRSWGHFLNDDL